MLMKIFEKTKEKSLFQKQFIFGSLHLGLRPYGQPGPLPLMVTLVALLIELEAQIFISWFLLITTMRLMRRLVKTVNKSSKKYDCYIDSDIYHPDFYFM